jgi:hypothetical protein
VLLQVKNGRERSSALRGLREMERQVGSVRGTRWTARLGAGHMVATQVRRSHGQASRCTVAVKSSGLAGGRRAHGVWWFAHKTIGGWFLGLRLKTKSEGPTRRRRDAGVSGSFEEEVTRRDRMACVGRTRGAAKAWPSDGKTHNHYLNAPTWVVSPVVKLGVVESFTTPAGPDI